MKPPRSSEDAVRAVVDKLTRDLTDRGQIIEAGWRGLEVMAIAPDAPAIQREEMRNAFFAGAQHLWSSILCVLDPEGEEPTPADMERMGLIQTELDRFIEEFKLRHFSPAGRA